MEFPEAVKSRVHQQGPTRSGDTDATRAGAMWKYCKVGIQHGMYKVSIGMVRPIEWSCPISLCSPVEAPN